MPSLFTLTLQAHRPATERPVTPAQLHGLAATLLEGAGANHHAQHKPYSTAPLQATRAPGTALLRLGWLPDTPRPDMTRMIGQPVCLGAQFFTVTDTDEQHTPYPALLHTPPADRAVMHFRSATYFSRNGRWYPLPDPALLYGGLTRRWNHFAPPHAHITDTDEKGLLDAVALTAHDIATTPVDLGNATRIGFTGTAAFRPVTTHDTPTAQLLAALTLFATASGVGAMTTHGLGAVDTELD